MIRKSRLYLAAALVAAAAGSGANLFAPPALRASDSLEAAADAAATYGNLYIDPNGTPKSVCICRDAATECAPCITLPQ